MKTAIENDDPETLRRLLIEEPARANALIAWGSRSEIRTHPLHYVSDMLAAGRLKGNGVMLVDVLIAAGADVNHRAANGETPLIGAASLWAEDVGLRLIDAGARADLTGAFGETALHWAAHEGLVRLVAHLIPAGAIDLQDQRYRATPLGWAIHGRFNTRRTGHLDVVRQLVRAGAQVRPESLTDQVRADPDLVRALQGDRTKP
jgi:uncharacterized protein